MNKKEKLVDVAKSDVNLDAEQTVATPVANATVSLTKKQSTLKGFRYSPEFVNVVFANGDSAILGKKDAETIRLAIELKGQSVEYRIGKEETSPKGTKYHKVLIDCIF